MVNDVGGDGEPSGVGWTHGESKQAKRFQERMDRLSKLNELRLQESSARKSSMAAATDPRENVDLFLSSFSEKREAVEVGLALANTGSIQPSSMKQHLEKLTLDVTAMVKSIADAAYFLPSSVVKASQNTITKLGNELEVATTELVPKKKFSFRSKQATSSDSLHHSQSIPPRVSNASAFNSTAQRKDISEASKPVTSVGAGSRLTSGSDCEEVSTLQHTEANNRERIEGKSNGTFVRDASELGGELMLSNLNECKVYLRGRLTSLVLHSLKKCHVFSGPVSGSVFIENVSDSVLVLSSHQIRIHSTSSTDFYLRVRSKPIVEYTSKNRFAPYAFTYDGVERDLRDANLGEETGLWEKVDDFRWLRAVHSPNWSVLPEMERMPLEDGSKVTGLGIESEE